MADTNSNVKCDVVWKLWERNSKSDFVKHVKAITKNNNSSPLFNSSNVKGGTAAGAGGGGGVGGSAGSGNQVNLVFRAIYDLLSLGIRGQIKKDLVLSTLNDISGIHADFPSIILDIIGIIDAETAPDGQQPENRANFCQIVKEIEKFLSEKLLKERLEIDTLQDVGTIKNNTFYTKFIKVKTKLYYKQRRFNLFREESEGYAKLITELNQDEHGSVLKTLEIIKSLIGCFNLDPNRVHDIILESFETRPEQSKLFIALLKAYMPKDNIICEVLGYKYRYFADIVTPNSLYIITALLLQSNIIRLDDIYSWLSPGDKGIISEWETEIDDAKEYVRKLNIISTNKDKEPIEVEEEKDDSEEKYAANQKWNLCEALLHVGDWKTAHQLIEKLPKQSILVKEPVAKALCDLIHRVCEPIYHEKCSMPSQKRNHVYSPFITKMQIPQAQNLQDLRDYAFPMATQLGPSLYIDPVLLYKLIRLIRVVLNEMNCDLMTSFPKDSQQEAFVFDILTLLDSSILPALSYMDCNCCVAEEIWSVIKSFPYHHRYSLYARWKNDTYLVHPKLIRRRGSAQKQIKALMKRVSKENVKPVGRLIGKLSHCSPGFLFDYILLQIQIYDNLIGPVVDSLKYLTSLSYDVLGYCLIEALAQADKNRFKHDGTSLSMWLQGSANFCGAIFKKYNIELSGLLQYVANQLKAHKSLDLLILKEVVQKMTGIEATEEMTIEQLNAMSGGELLRSEAGYFSQVRNTKKSSQRLKDALASNDLAVTLCLLMAQQKHCVVYRETAHNHLKLVGKLYDQCQDTLVQFGTFLGSTYSVDEYVERLPSIQRMLQEYHIHLDVAFFLARPMFTHQITQKYDQLAKSDSAKKLSTTQKQEKYLEATAAVFAPIIESVRPLHSPKVWADISPQFLVTFWSLSMYDLMVPVDSYQKEINKIKQQSLAVLDSKDINASKGRKEQERYQALIDKLQDEKKKQQDHVDKILRRLNQEKDSWFLSKSAKSAKNETITQFLQLCLFPRCTFTALDAVYCAKFLHTIHTLKTANFATLLCYDRIFCDITYSVTSCTENEATRYGRFLCAMLETVMKWHENPTTFTKECENFPGFVTKFRVSNQFSEANDLVGYENYRHVCHKWHYKITKAMVFCLESKDYMQIRNAFIILMRILPHFPMLIKLAQIIERKVEKVRDEERNQRQDLFVLASSYIGQLKSKSNDMIRESDFHILPDKPNKETTSSTTSGGGGGGGGSVIGGGGGGSNSTSGNNGNATTTLNNTNENTVKAVNGISQNDTKDSTLSSGAVINNSVNSHSNSHSSTNNGGSSNDAQSVTAGATAAAAPVSQTISTISSSSTTTSKKSSSSKQREIITSNNTNSDKESPHHHGQTASSSSTSSSLSSVSKHRGDGGSNSNSNASHHNNVNKEVPTSSLIINSHSSSTATTGSPASVGGTSSNSSSTLLHIAGGSSSSSSTAASAAAAAATTGTNNSNNTVGGSTNNNITSSSSSSSSKEKSTKESKREEKQREKELESDQRKRDRERDREKRRERKTTPPATYYEPSINERYYSTSEHQYEQHVDRERERDRDRGGERERDRDLSSISNSSNGSTNRRSQESPEHSYDRESKRRKLEINSKDEIKKERSSKSKDKKEKQQQQLQQSWEENELRKEKRLGRKRTAKISARSSSKRNS